MRPCGLYFIGVDWPWNADPEKYQCDPDGYNPCCDDYWDGICSQDCSCKYCVNYSNNSLTEWRKTGEKQKWRSDGKCGLTFPLPDNSPSQCNPDGETPCCNSLLNGECGKSLEHCTCEFCINYDRLHREWQESGGKIKWRYDGLCGVLNPLPDGSPSQCDPESENPCCSFSLSGYCIPTNNCTDCAECVDYKYLKDWQESGGEMKWRYDGRCGSQYFLPDNRTFAECNPNGENPCCDGTRCGNTLKHCDCNSCTNYSQIHSEWEESGGIQKWRHDGRCGEMYLLPDGSSSQCDPDGEVPCCNEKTGQCGNSAEHCFCANCTDYKYLKDWNESGGTMNWRNDKLCGKNDFLLDGRRSECDPNGDKPCCGKNGICENSTSAISNCLCSDCVDYRFVKMIRESGDNCTAAKLDTGYLKNVCFNDSTKHQYFKCIHSDTIYDQHWHEYLRERKFSSACENDPVAYQACGFETKLTPNADVLCGGYVCGVEKQNYWRRYTYYGNYVKCVDEYCRLNKRGGCFPTATPINDMCNDECDDTDSLDYYCKDERNCNGYKYGIICYRDRYTKMYLSVLFLCSGILKCDNGADMHDCTVENSTVQTCTQYFMKVFQNKTITVPLTKNYTRCSLLPYCLEYLDQTNCSDVERVAGYCEVNGYMSSISKYVLCEKLDENTKRPIKLCDDDLQKNCLTPFPDCKIHKHWMCDGVKDCSEGSDETNDMCAVMTDMIGANGVNFTCKRRFRPGKTAMAIPVSWILDNQTDCMNGEDENQTRWEVCHGKMRQISQSYKDCQDVYKCFRGKSFVTFNQLCDGVESCGDTEENTVCGISRDFPEMNTTASFNLTIPSVCNLSVSACEVKRFKRPWGDVFGEELDVYVPASKVHCSDLFGENYLILSCMNLCIEKNATCLLDDDKRKLKHDSCPGQYPNRSYTLGNNSFLTFVDDPGNGKFHQNFYQCNNTKCIEYKQVCDLANDCGDMSDELNCMNHMVCKNTLNTSKYEFISLSQKCDGIYDCFDLSDECNDSCRRYILENLALKGYCWIIGILAVILNLFTVTRSLTSLKHCVTEGMMTSKVLMNFIGCGDFLLGVYLIILSIYDSIVYGEEYCENQAVWLTGAACLSLGVTSTIGSQLSLFSMTVMSCIRLHGVRSMRIPGPVNRLAVGKVTLLAIAILTATFSVAFIPLVPQLEDYFVQGMYYDPDYKVFIGFPNKEKHVRVLDAYYKLEKISSNISWSKIGEKVDGMFTQDHGSLSRSPVHFYGNDGLCLFKYFVRTDDARRSRNSTGSDEIKYDPVVWTMLAVNLLCFTIITLCYIAIGVKTKKSVRESGQQDNPIRLKEVAAVNNKIRIIIATDFFCWVPFIFISGLHNLQYINASTWYATFAMIVLPLNSVINPLIYDAELKGFIDRGIIQIRKFVEQVISTAAFPVRMVLQRKSQDTLAEEIQMSPINQTSDYQK